MALVGGKIQIRTIYHLRLSLQYSRNSKGKRTKSISVSGIPADRNDGT